MVQHKQLHQIVLLQDVHGVQQKVHVLLKQQVVEQVEDLEVVQEVEQVQNLEVVPVVEQEVVLILKIMELLV